MKFTKFFLYSFAFMANFVSGGILFIAAYNFTKAEKGGIFIGLTLAIWGLMYIVWSLFIGKITTPKNCTSMVCVAGLLISLCALLFIVFPNLWLQYVWLAILGLAFAVYCTPFQVLSKSIESSSPTDKSGVLFSAASYTVAWSLGMASGPFFFGLLSSKQAFIIDFFIGLYMALGAYMAKRIASNKQISETAAVASPEVAAEVEVPVATSAVASSASSSMPDLVKLGWWLGASTTLAVSIVRTMMPPHADSLGFTKADSGYLLFVVSFAQAVAAFVLRRRGAWLYDLKSLLLVQVLGIVSLVMFAGASTLFWLYVASVIYGIYSACCYVGLVFHSLIHPTKSARYVSINEALVGVTSIAAPFAGGYVLQVTEKTSATFYMVAVTTLITAFAIIPILLKARKETA